MTELLKKKKDLYPYFLWYMKTNILLPKKRGMILMQGSSIQILQQLLDYDAALNALVRQLVLEGIDSEDIHTVIDEVCDHLFQEIGLRKILNGNPELLIQHEQSKN